MSIKDEETQPDRRRLLLPSDETRLVEDLARIIQQTLLNFETADKTNSHEMQGQLETAASALKVWTQQQQKESPTVIPLFAGPSTSDTPLSSSIQDDGEKE